MAHYGYLVFRLGYPLSVFDNGLDDYLGNVIFLEGHKQNSANFSEAGSSGTLVCFGAFSSAFILECLVPLIGFGLIAREREDETLKILSTQGASGREIIWGKVLGLWQFSLLFLLPVLPVVCVVAVVSGAAAWTDSIWRVFTILPAYMVYYFFISSLTIDLSSQ